MTIDELRAMPERERDALIATSIMTLPLPEGLDYDDKSKAWGRFRDGSGNAWWFEEHWPPRYSSDPAADYLVLKAVREAWDESRQWKFVRALASILRVRDTSWTTFGTLWLVLFGNGDAAGLRVGDYSLAALLVVTADDTAPARR